MKVSNPILVKLTADGRALLVHFRKGTVLYHMSFNAPVYACSFSPDGKYFAISHNNGVQVWETPSLLVREFAPFVLHGTYTGHQGEVIGITWSKTGRYVNSRMVKNHY
jgi:periodic tryptophan protein 2